jgi:pSer/pThr/pTyr-binding forkhead associated (FHA) protein
MRTWIIGSGPDCDVVVVRPRVSRRHCRFTELADGFLIEDLGSSNGTYVNGERIAAATRVAAGDAVTLGALEPLPWPPNSGVPGWTVFRIGRTADNEIVLDDPRVSSHHARLLISGDRTLIEDTGSSNGTFVNAPDRRVTDAIPLSDTDTIYFGSLAVPALQLRPGRTAPAPAAVPSPVPQDSPHPADADLPTRQSTAPSLGGVLQLVQAPAIAILIILVLGRQPSGTVTAANSPVAAEGIASAMFALAISALWLGGSLAAWAALVGRSSANRGGSLEASLRASPAGRYATLAGLCVIECAILLAIVYGGIGLRGPWMAMAGVLILTSAVGLSLGLMIFAVARTTPVAVTALAFAIAAMTVMGGRIWRLPDSGAMATLAAATPSRWAFEGLLLLETGALAAPSVTDGPVPGSAADLAEGFFPARSQRMGPKADAMALGFMLVGLAGATAYLATRGKPVPRMT